MLHLMMISYIPHPQSSTKMTEVSNTVSNHVHVHYIMPAFLITYIAKHSLQRTTILRTAK